MNEPAKILHLHSTFSLGGKEARAVRLMNVFGKRASHTILSAMPEALGARDAIDPAIAADFPQDAPSLIGKPGVRRYRALARYMRQFDLVLSYNWGSMDGVMTHRLFGSGLPPIIHHEDGFNADEADRLKSKRNIYRRLAFPTLHALVVPSLQLRRIARTVWKQPEGRVRQISNGIPVERYAEPPEFGAIPGFERQPGDVVVGTIAGLREVKDLPRLVRAVAELPDNVRLVIAGEGPEREAIEAEARRCGISGRVSLAGFLDRPSRYVGHFDIFALSSRSEQFPISVVEAMAAGLPVASPSVGDVESMVSAENRPLVALGEVDLAGALKELAGDEGLRAAIGAANREKAASHYDEGRMIGEYAGLYEGALGRPGLFTA
ncbi:glycosyltransferase [Parasphingopyxis lamellibrachiae]|uniref:Glycosyltransferase involved in cell wall biosynthesis n=1 Tax=Parasphingopyxis lamellibrachiae TaxID=680125 RepID=A0A3D9FDB5_9SPHN|nr:glycosyltransferase [Parasphingopyxis lamellibrachiae]RED15815.1 glycosyltransferase involved in cell wall biosynthesis [Parasphingopyxis lamellibrachiae]